MPLNTTISVEEYKQNLREIQSGLEQLRVQLSQKNTTDYNSELRTQFQDDRHHITDETTIETVKWAAGIGVTVGVIGAIAQTLMNMNK